jgi:thiol-disulfide isomerase/thioredoxin
MNYSENNLMFIRKPVLAALIMVLFSGILTAQQETRKLRFTLEDFRNGMVKLVEYYGQDRITVDSVVVDEEGRGVFILDDSYKPGMYRIQTKNGRGGIDVIYNHEDIDLLVKGYFILDSVVVYESDENKVFYEYIRIKNSFENRLSLLEPVVMYYPVEEDFYGIAEKEYLKLEKDYTAFLDSLFALEGITIAPTVIRWDQLPDLEPGEMDPDLRAYYRNHYFDNVSPDDTVMIRTPVLPVRIIDYLSLFVMPGISREAQENEFIAGVDALMQWCSGNGTMQEVVINYLIDGFQLYGFEKVMTHIVENYVLNNSCVAEQEQEKLRFRIEGFKKMAVGNTVPDFELKDVNGDWIKLSGVDKDYILLVFWSSWCPHCADIMPGLNELYDRFGANVEFIGVSVDEKRGEWIAAVEEKGIDWPNVAELKGWDGKVVTEYYVYATPTLLLLDNALRIVAKPAGMDELVRELENLEQQ